MLQIDGLFRRPRRRMHRSTVSATRQTPSNRPVELHTEKKTEQAEETVLSDEASPVEEIQESEPAAPVAVEETEYSETEPVPSDESVETEVSDSDKFPQTEADVSTDGELSECEQTPVTVPDSFAETDELEHISEKIGMDVSDMIDMGKEDVLIRQIDEFREKAKQLQQLMQQKETRAKELEGVVKEQTAKADSLERMVHARRTEADKIMEQVSNRFDVMSEGVRTEMTGLSDTVSKEVTGLTQNLTQNLTQELSRSAEETRQVVETATQNMIDQNTRSLEGLKEQLDALSHSEQIGELSNEMSTQMTTLKTDLVEKIHAEDVKCYRNIQASLDEQSKLLSENNEKLCTQLDDQVDELFERLQRNGTMVKVSLILSILNLLGVAGIIAFIFIR